MRIVDLFFAFPFLVLVIAIVAMLGPSVLNMFIAIWLTSWITYARIIRGHTLAAKRQEYALAAKALGYRRTAWCCATSCRTSSRSCSSSRWSTPSATSSSARRSASSASARSRPSPEWGAMISDGQSYILTSWWLPTMPGLAIVIVGRRVQPDRRRPGRLPACR